MNPHLQKLTLTSIVQGRVLGRVLLHYTSLRLFVSLLRFIQQLSCTPVGLTQEILDGQTNFFYAAVRDNVTFYALQCALWPVSVRQRATCFAHNTKTSAAVQMHQKRVGVSNTRGVHILRSPNLLFILKNYSPQEAENVVISLRNHPVDIHIFHNAHATIAWP